MKHLIVILAALIIACGCSQPVTNSADTRLPNGTVISTVEHDGYKFVVARGGGISIILHPDEFKAKKP